MTYADRAIEYANRCVSGEEVVCYETRLAAERMLRDLEQKKWRYDRKLADHACRFLEMLPIIDGGPDRNIVLGDWQCFIVCNIFGWVGPGGLRRFYYVTQFIGRGNAKSFLASAIALYVMFGMGQTDAEGYTAASALRTARIVWKTCSDMLQLRPKLAEKLGIKIGKHALSNDRGCVLAPVSSKTNNNFGQRTALVVIDELHVVDEELYAALSKGLGKRRNALMLSVTTAGADNEGLGKRQRDLVSDILRGRVQNDRHFCCVWEAESVDDLHDQNEWKKANPALGTFLMPEVLEMEANEATTQQARLDFIIYRLNRFAGNVVGAWIPPGKWEANADPSLRIEDYRGRAVYIGIDLAFRRDLCSKVYIFPEDRSDGLHYVVFQTSYVPSAQAELYPTFRTWEHDKRLTIVPGDITDLQLFEDELMLDLATYDVRGLLFDQTHAIQMWANLGRVGAPIIQVAQRTSGLSDPMKAAEEAILKGRIHHDGDPLFAWAIENTCAFKTAQGNVFPQKESKGSIKRIDPAVALITAMTAAQSHMTTDNSFPSLV